MEMKKKYLYALIYTLNAIFSGHSRLVKEIPTKDIISKRKLLEQQHYDAYLLNEVLYRNWPEVNHNPKYDCKRFLQRVSIATKKISEVTAATQKVILNYKHINEQYNNKLAPKRVTALQCKPAAKMWHRLYIYFIRSTKAPDCALFLNRIRKRSLNFYIVEDICEYREYIGFYKYMKELEVDKPNRLEGNKKVRDRRQMLQLPIEEIKEKHAEFERRHYKYCSINAEICKEWPEVLKIEANECQRFLSSMIPKNQDLSLVTAMSHQVILHYLEIKDEKSGCLDPVIVNAIACGLPQPIEKRTHVYFMRAPSYPTCVFFGVRKMMLTQQFYITEEICDAPGHKISLHSLFFEQAKYSKCRRREQYWYEAIEKMHTYEELHFQDYLIRQTEYELWPELEGMNIVSYCKTLVEIMLSQIVGMYEIGNLTAQVKPVKLKYAIKRKHLKKMIPLKKVKALDCLVNEKHPPNRFSFIRTPTSHNCVYLIKCCPGRSDTYFIAREICKDSVIFSDQLEKAFDDIDDMWTDILMDNDFMDYLSQDTLNRMAQGYKPLI